MAAMTTQTCKGQDDHSPQSSKPSRNGWRLEKTISVSAVLKWLVMAAALVIGVDRTYSRMYTELALMRQALQEQSRWSRRAQQTLNELIEESISHEYRIRNLECSKPQSYE